MLTIKMKYSPERARTISGIKRVSKPGLRIYSKADQGPPRPRRARRRRPVDQQGLMTDREARKRRRRRRGPLLRVVMADMSRIGKTPIPVPSGVDVTSPAGTSP